MTVEEKAYNYASKLVKNRLTASEVAAHYRRGYIEGQADIKQQGWHPASATPIHDAPYISVVFCKGRNGWLPFTCYGCDISPKKTVEFINCINDAADVLNEKEE